MNTNKAIRTKKIFNRTVPKSLVNIVAIITVVIALVAVAAMTINTINQPDVVAENNQTAATTGGEAPLECLAEPYYDCGRSQETGFSSATTSGEAPQECLAEPYYDCA